MAKPSSLVDTRVVYCGVLGLSSAVGSSANGNGMGLLAMAVSDPPTPREVRAIADKFTEMIKALRRA